MKTSRKILSLISLILIIVTALPTSAFASEAGELLGKHSYISSTVGISLGKGIRVPDMNSEYFLIANAGRSNKGETVGNTVRWDYSVSAVYTGNEPVEYIKTGWKVSADLRNSASMKFDVGEGTITAGSSSKWRNVTTGNRYLINNNGAKSVEYNGKIIISPKGDYKADSMKLVNNAMLKLKNYPATYSVTVSA
jgi:hypothetical protein